MPGYINQRTKIYTTANSVDEVRTMFSVLELGTDGVIFTTNDENQVSKLGTFLENVNFPLQAARIVEVKDVGTRRESMYRHSLDAQDGRRITSR